MSTQDGKTTGIKDMRLRLAAAALAVGLTAGCAPDLEIRQQPMNTAQWIQLSHKVNFAPGQASLSPEAARAIDAFVYRSEIAYGDRIVVKGGSARTTAPALAAQRAKSVAAYLRRHRIPSRHSPAVAITLGADQSAIVVGRYIVVAPDCPAWSDILAGGDLSTETKRFGPFLGYGSGSVSGSVGGTMLNGTSGFMNPSLGCVTASALGAQVADPGDLVNGGRLGPGDGQFFSRGMRRYRADKTKETKSVKTSGEGK